MFLQKLMFFKVMGLVMGSVMRSIIGLSWGLVMMYLVSSKIKSNMFPAKHNSTGAMVPVVWVKARYQGIATA